MTAVSYGATMGAISIVFLVLTVAIGVLGVVRTRGRVRALVSGGIGAILLSHLVGALVPLLVGLVDRAGGPDTFFRVQVVVNAAAGLLLVAGFLLLVLAAIAGSRSQHPAPSSDRPVPGAPGTGVREHPPS